MFERILVPLDGSGRDESVIAQVKRFASPDAELILLHVMTPAPAPVTVGPSGGGSSGSPAKARAYLEGVSIPGRWSPWLRVVRAQDPANAILKDAHWLGVDLVAMTALGSGGVAEAVLESSDIPLLMARPGIPVRSGPIRRILVPLVGDRLAESILYEVRSLALETNAEVVLLHSVDEDPHSAPRSTAQLEARATELRDEGIRVATQIRTGAHATVVPQVATELDVDLVAMATGERGGVLPGGATPSVLHQARRPILLRRLG